MMHSAARTRTDAGVPWSSITFSRMVAAAVVPCWSLATACEYDHAPRFAVSRLELRQLLPTHESGDGDTYRPGSLFHVSLGEQRGNGCFHLAAEL